MAALAGIATELLPTSVFGGEYVSSDFKSSPDFWTNVKEQFRLKDELIYLNNAGLGASPNSVINEVVSRTDILEKAGSTGHSMLEDIRENTAIFLGANPSEICFTRNATEGMNIIANEVDLCKGDEVIMSTHEHVGGSMPWVNVANKRKAKIRLVDLDLSGETNFDRITSSFNKKTKVLVLSHVTCSTGMRLPIKELAKYCKERGVKICVDGAQAVGLIKVDLGDLQPDYYTCSGHKWLFGPKGTGILYIASKNLDELKPLYVGAYSDKQFNIRQQEFVAGSEARRYEYGTRNIPAISGLNEGIKFLQEISMNKVEDRGVELHNYLRSLLEGKVEFLSPQNEEYQSGIITIRHPKLVHDEFPTHCLNKLKLKIRGIYEADLGGIRISCAVYNSKEELKRCADLILEFLNE